MKALFVKDSIKYDGSQLSSLWAYRNYTIQGDSILSFRGPCQVHVEKMVDVEDVLGEAAIYSEEMLHFIIEHFDLDLAKAVLRQRLFMAIIKETLEKHGVTGIVRKGDDLYLSGKKLSVSIATISPVSTLIHTGLNIISDNTPVASVGLKELAIENVEAFAHEVMENYLDELASIDLARCKVRGVL